MSNEGQIIGIIGGINILIDTLRAHQPKILDTDRLAVSFEEKRDEWRATLDPVWAQAAFAIDQILRPLKNESLRNAHILQDDPPSGNA